ncbi:hypothetical protein ABIE44_002564 [Marmoricola sp. OAE513]
MITRTGPNRLLVLTTYAALVVAVLVLAALR